MRLLVSICGPVALVLVLGLPVLRGFGQSTTQPKKQDMEYPEGLSDEAIRRLDKWIKGTEENHPPSSLRDIFGKDAVVTPRPPVTVLPPSEPDPPTGPVLKGFVYTRKGQGHPQPLAAIDHEKQMFLVGVGDTVGPYRVERVDAGDAVLLVELATGEKLQLTLN